MQIAALLRRKATAPAEAPEDAPATDDTAPKPSFRTRFHAWWEGYDAPQAVPAADADQRSERPAAKTPAAKPPAKQPAGKDRWPRERIEVAQILWGKEFLSPLGADAIIALTQPLELSQGMSALHLGCGLGGGTRAIAQHYSVAVTGMEESAGLVQAGMELSTRAKLKTKVPIAVCDLPSVEFKHGAFHRVVIEHVTHTLDDKEATFKRIAHALKADGQMLILDFLYQGKAAGATIASWAEIDPAPVHPWNLDSARKTLAKLHIDLRTVEDQTDRCRELIVKGLDAFLQGAANQALNRALTPVLKREVDLWARRKAALDAGELKAFALYGVKRGEAG